MQDSRVMKRSVSEPVALPQSARAAWTGNMADGWVELTEATRITASVASGWKTKTSSAGNPLLLTKSCLPALRGSGCCGSGRCSAGSWEYQDNRLFRTRVFGHFGGVGGWAAKQP